MQCNVHSLQSLRRIPALSTFIATINLSAKPTSLDYLAGEGMNAKFDKQTARRLEDIEGLPQKGKNIVYKMIDMALVYSKTKKALAH